MFMNKLLMTPKESNLNNTGRSPELDEWRSPVCNAADHATPEWLNNVLFNPFGVASWRVCGTTDFVGGYWGSIPPGL